MAVLNFNLRGISPEVMSLLKHEAKENHISVNLLILNLVEQGVGFSHKVKRKHHHDLDHLAGTWSKEEGKVFMENIKSFEKIDMELWA
jgi:hypothetical protein